MSLCNLCTIHTLYTFPARSENVVAKPNTATAFSELRPCEASAATPSALDLRQNDRFRRVWRRPKPENHNINGKQTFIPWPERQAAITAVQNSENVLETLQKEGSNLQTEDLNLSLRYFGSMQKWNEVLQLFYWMQKHGKASVASYTSFISLMGKGRRVKSAMECYGSLKEKNLKLNVFICNAILSCLIFNKKVEYAFKLFKQMRQEGLTPDHYTFSMLIKACSYVDNSYPRACKLLKSFRKTGLKPDVVIYGSLLALCASKGLDKEAESYFEEMKTEGLSPNEFHYSSLLKAYAANGKYKEAAKLIAEMKSRGLVLNEVVLTSLLTVYVRSGCFVEAHKLFVEMDALGYAATEMPYSILIDGFVKAGAISKAEKVFDKMKENGIEPGGYCYNTLISAYSKSGNFVGVRELDAELENTNGRRNLVMMNTLLRAYVKEGNMKHILWTLKTMDAYKICPDQQTFVLLIRHFCNAKLYDLALRSTEDMQSRGYLLTAAICSPLIQGLGEAGQVQKAFKIYNQLKASEHMLSRALHEAMSDMLISEGMLSDSYKILQENRNSVSKPCIENLIIACCKAGDTNMVIDVLTEYSIAGYKMEKELLNTVLSSYSRNCKRNDLSCLLKFLRNQGYAKIAEELHPQTL